MTVQQMNGLTQQIAFPIEVRAYHGTNIARLEIDFYYDDLQDYDACASLNRVLLTQGCQPLSNMRGGVIFTIVKDRDEIHQTLIIPRLTAKAKLSREIFAVWAPYFDGKSFSKSNINAEFLTDSQGFELMKRKVYTDEDKIEFSAAFYPVDSLISM